MIIKSTKWEQMTKQDFQAASQKFQQAVDQGSGKGYDFQDFSQDLYSYLYKSSAPEIPQHSPSKGSEWASKALNEIRNIPEFANLRDNGTSCDSFRSGIGAQVLTKHFAESLEERRTENPDDLEEQMGAMEEGSAAQQAAQEALDASLSEWGSDDPSKLRRVLRAALAEAEETMEALEEGMLGFGIGTAPGDDGFSNMEEKIKLAAKIEENPKLREISELAGRMQAQASHQRSNKRDAGPDEISSIELGDNLSRVLPSELQMLDDEDLEILFLKNFAEKGLMQYRLEENIRETKGPMVLCIDMSSSMQGINEIWAKAIALAMAHIAQQDKRDYHIIQFGSSVTSSTSWPTSSPISALELANTMSTSPSGGTDFAQPLNIAFDTIETSKEFSKADIVFITDGAANLSDEEIAKYNKAKENGVEIIGIEIGSYPDSPLEDLSDSFHRISDPNKSMSALEEIFSI